MQRLNDLRARGLPVILNGRGRGCTGNRFVAMPSRVLIVDDDTDIRESLKDALGDLGYDATSCGSAPEALALLDVATFDVVLTDVRMPVVDGIALCARIAGNHCIPVIVMTAFGDVSAAVDATRAGAFDFITKPFELNQVAAALKRALGSSGEHRIQKLSIRSADLNFREIVGESAAIHRLHEQLARIASTDATVLVTGESGTGKELIARALHRNGPRRNGPFLALNCAAVPAQLLESELFGHAKGAYTGASDARRGLLVQADGGTLFLDEVGAMPADLQPALLRVLQDRVVRPVGGAKEEAFDVRVIAATNTDLREAVRGGAFRDALLFRLAVLRVEGPPLRERGDDVVVLARHFVHAHAARAGVPPLEIAEAALARLRAYPWPGNVRELQNCVESSMALAAGAWIEEGDLPAEIRSWSGHRDQAAVGEASLDSLQRDQLEEVLRAVGGNKAEAARVLGIDRVTLYRRIKRFASTG